jgi:hypothetical protein
MVTVFTDSLRFSSLENPGRNEDYCGLKSRAEGFS